MLHEFLTDSREKIISRTQEKVASRRAPRPTDIELKNGIPLFLTQLVGMLQSPPESFGTAIGESATKHGNDLLRTGFTIGQVVHDYGGLCQAITEVALEEQVPITTAEFKTLNACLDDAIAAAVSEFGRQSMKSASDAGTKHLGFLAHEMRNALNSATLAFEVIKRGTVGATGSTSSMLARNLDRMREIIDRSLVEVRLSTDTHNRVPLSVAKIIEDIAIQAEVDARHRGLQFTVGSVDIDVHVDADPHLLLSALTNLLQNAFKFTRVKSNVSLLTVVTSDRVRIDVADECGGLPEGNIEDLFASFEQRGTDRSGIGLGLTISRQAIAASGGTIDVRNEPGKGCVFSVELPRLH